MLPERLFGFCPGCSPGLRSGRDNFPRRGEPVCPLLKSGTFFIRHGPGLFKKRGFFSFLYPPKYDPGPLESFLRAGSFGRKTLGDLHRPCMVVAAEFSEGRPVVFTNLNPSQRDIPCVEAALATSAAPSYLPPRRRSFPARCFSTGRHPREYARPQRHLYCKEVPDGVRPGAESRWRFSGTRQGFCAPDEVRGGLPDGISQSTLPGFFLPYLTQSNEQTSAYWGKDLRLQVFLDIRPGRIQGAARGESFLPGTLRAGEGTLRRIPTDNSSKK